MAELNVGDSVIVDKNRTGEIIYIIPERAAAGIEFKEIDGSYTYSVFPLDQLERISQ